MGPATHRAPTRPTSQGKLGGQHVARVSGIAALGHPSRQCRSARPAAAAASASYAPATESVDMESQADFAKLVSTFKAADQDSDGVLQREELRALLERVGDGLEPVPMRWVTDADLDRILDQYDANKDGVISFEEFTALAQDKVFLTRALREYREAFNAFDKGGNGTVSPTELFQLFTKLESPLKDYDRICKLMDKYDVDGNGQLDFGEFLRLCRDEDALPLLDILDYAAKGSSARAAAPAAPPAAPSAAAPGIVSTFFSTAEFEAVMAANPDSLIVVMASLTWCRPCKKIVPAYENLAAAYPSTVMLKFFGNSNEDTKAFFKETLKTRVTPSFFFFRGGQLAGSCTGANAPRFEQNLRSHLREEELVSEVLYPPPS